MPGMTLTFKGETYTVKDWEEFYQDYVRTYIERDVKKVISVEKERDFLRFLDYMALRTGQQINYED